MFFSTDILGTFIICLDIRLWVGHRRKYRFFAVPSVNYVWQIHTECVIEIYSRLMDVVLLYMKAIIQRFSIRRELLVPAVCYLCK